MNRDTLILHAGYRSDAGAFLMEASTHAVRRPLALALAVVAAAEFIALLLYVRARSVEARRAA